MARDSDTALFKAWNYRPFGDVFAGSLGPMLVDTLGTPTQPAPKDPRALIANPRAAAPRVSAALIPGCSESSVRKTTASSKSTTSKSTVATLTAQKSLVDRLTFGWLSPSDLFGDWLLVDVGAGPWVWCLAATQDKATSLFRLPGVPNTRAFQCELKRTDANIWILEDCPDESRPPRQLCALCPRFKVKERRGWCCRRRTVVEDLAFTFVIPKVLKDNRCCQIRVDPARGAWNGLWEMHSQQLRDDIMTYEGSVYVDRGDVSIELGSAGGYNLLSMSRQPRAGPWKFHFNAPLSVAQALACMTAVARMLPVAGSWGSKPRGVNLVQAGDNEEGAVPWPAYWARKSSQKPKLYDASLAIDFMQRLISATFRPVFTRDRGTSRIPSALQVVAVLRMENPEQWKRYQYRKGLVRRNRKDGFAPITPPLQTMSMFDPAFVSTLDSDVNEVYLFHGTTPEAALSIQQHGFDLARAGANKGKMFGGGVYFAEECAKSDEYASMEGSALSCFLFCRVILGATYVQYSAVEDMEHRLDRTVYDSVIGDRKAAVGTYREMIVYEEAHTYPEYIVIYNRSFADRPCAKPQLRDTTGDGMADHVSMDTNGDGSLDRTEPIAPGFLEYFKHVPVAPSSEGRRPTERHAAIRFADDDGDTSRRDCASGAQAHVPLSGGRATSGTPPTSMYSGVPPSGGAYPAAPPLPMPGVGAFSGAPPLAPISAGGVYSAPPPAPIPGGDIYGTRPSTYGTPPQSRGSAIAGSGQTFHAQPPAYYAPVAPPPGCGNPPAHVASTPGVQPYSYGVAATMPTQYPPAPGAQPYGSPLGTQPYGYTDGGMPPPPQYLQQAVDPSAQQYGDPIYQSRQTRSFSAGKKSLKELRDLE